MQYVLIGNYGVGNFGDEALREYFLSAFPLIQWKVLSAHPKLGEYPRLPAGIRSLFTPWWRTLGALRKSDGVVFGGGTLFTDVESVQACLLWWWHALWAWIFGKRIILAYQGIGPFKSRVGPIALFALRGAGEWCARWVVRHAVFVSVRDAVSFQRVQSWSMNLKIVQTYDPVLMLLSSRKTDERIKNMFCIIPRRNSPDSFVVRAHTLASERSWGGISILSLQPDDPAERSVCAQLAEQTKGTVISIRTIGDLAHAVFGASFVLTQRYHGAIAALALGVPFEVVRQGEGDKLAAVSSPQTAGECLALAKHGEDALRMALER